MSNNQGLRNLLAHPATRDLTLDDPRTTDRRRAIIRSNGFLARIYDEWYSRLAACIPEGPGRVLELGSGAGFFSEYVPGLITSEVFSCSGIQLVTDARQLPFPDACLKSIAMVDVFHHIPDARAFLSEAARSLRPGGSLAMIEPWVSPWSRLIYGHLHHEPFHPDAQDWGFPASGPLSGANGALPWIVFERDRRIFERDFPHFEIRSVQPFMPFRYLVSGGVSMRQLMPGFTFGSWRAVESLFTGWPMFALVHVVRAPEIVSADPRSPEALELIRALSEELARRYDYTDDGSGNFKPEDPSVFLVARAAGRAVACGAFRPMEPRVAEIKRMFVLPEARGRGYAYAVLTELERLAREQGFTATRLETGDRQPEAIRLYERAGYRRIPCFGIYANDPRSVCFEKALSSSAPR